jgi:antitoxin VapB
LHLQGLNQETAEKCQHCLVALNIKDQEAEQLAAEVAKLTGESETEAVRRALRERHDRLRPETGERRRPEGGLLHYLETEIWPHIPEELRGRPPMTKAEKAEALGYGPDEA